MAAISWASAKAGGWTVAADWVGGQEPGSGDDVTIGVTGKYIVSLAKTAAANSLTLDDAEATFADKGSLTLGTTFTLAQGGVKVEDGGQLLAAFVDAGSQVGGAVSVKVDGAGSRLSTAFLLVGDAGWANFGITNGATVAVTSAQPDAAVGQQAGSHGVLTIDGPGSSLTTTGNIAVGGAGTGMLSVTNDGSFNASLIDIGFQAGGVGAVNVSGAGSHIVDTGTLIVGDAGTGTLQLTNAGFVSVQGFFLVGFNSHGAGPGASSGTASITDATLDVGFSGVGIGENGIGTLALGVLGSLSDEGGVTVGVAGTLAMSGGTLQAASLSNAGTVSGFGAISGPIANSGAVEADGGALAVSGAFTDAGSVAIDKGASLVLAGSGSTLSGAVSGGGALVFLGGDEAIDAGASLSVANWALSGGTAGLNETLTYDGAYSETAGATLVITGGDTLTLSGPAALGGTLNGAGAVTVGAATLDGLTVGGKASLGITGAAIETGAVTVGDATASGASLSIAKGASLDIDGAFGIAQGRAGSNLKVIGMLIAAAGSGTSTIGVKTTDGGVIEAASGTLDLAGAVGGKGVMAVDGGATLEVDSAAASALSMQFNGGDAVLALRNASAFAASIAGFASTDSIDLLGAQATGVSLGAGDVLTIVNGSSVVAALQLSGDYAGDTFSAASDGSGGADITVSAGGPAVHTSGAGAIAAAGHRFVAAMARLGGAGSAAIHPGQVSVGCEATLIKPR